MRVTTGVGEYAEARLSRDGRSMVATAYTVRESLATLPSGGEGPRPVPLAPDVTGDIHPVLSPKGDRIAFSSSRGGDRNIWTARPDGTDPRMVTAGAANDERPAWSPDGSRIAFVSSRGGRRGLWVTDADGGTPRHVRDAVLDTVTWSPDGSQIVYAAPFGRLPALFAVRADGGAHRRIPTPAGATAPSWSAVSNVIAYIEPRPGVGAQPTRAEVAFVSGTSEVARPPLTGGPSLANGSIAWSPDGLALAAVVDRGAAAASVWVLPLEGPARRLIERSQDRRPRGITWTPDGWHVIIGPVERTADVVLFDQGR